MAWEDNLLEAKAHWDGRSLPMSTQHTDGDSLDATE